MEQYLANAKVFAKMKDFQKAIMELRKLEYYLIHHPEEKTINPEKVGGIYLGMAEIFDEVEDVEQAIIY